MQHFLAGVDAAFAGDFEKSVKEHKAERRAGFTRCARDLPRAGVSRRAIEASGRGWWRPKSSEGLAGARLCKRG
jgi:hypothetical protein